MARKKISFDCDGVLAQGGWVDVPDRTNSFYARKSAAHPEVVPSLHWLSTLYDIYVISTRGHVDANLGLRGWLHWMLGLDLDTIAGVITHPYTDEQTICDPHGRMDKGTIVRDLGILVHFDDEPRHVEACGTRGVLYPSDMEHSLDASGVLPTVTDWETIRSFLTTPGMLLTGSNGTIVRSPASEWVTPKTNLDFRGLYVN